MSVFVPSIMNWNLPGLGFNEFTLNHFRIYPESNLRLCNISPNIFPQEVGFNEFTLSYFRICPKSNLRLCNISPNIFPQELNVLLSAKLHMSDFETDRKMWNKKRTLNWSFRYPTNLIPPLTEAETYFCPLFAITEVIY